MASVVASVVASIVASVVASVAGACVGAVVGAVEGFVEESVLGFDVEPELGFVEELELGFLLEELELELEPGFFPEPEEDFLVVSAAVSSVVSDSVVWSDSASVTISVAGSVGSAGI